MKQNIPVPSDKQDVPMDDVLRRMLNTPPGERTKSVPKESKDQKKS
jgi:hypothetical protein